MSRIDELKKQHPSYAMSAIDIYKMMSPNQSSKYIEMLIKLDKTREFNEPDAYRRQMIECMVGWGIDYNYLETFDLETLNMFFLSVNNLMGEQGKIISFTKFASLNERKLIENNDITSYSSWDEIEQAISLAEIKLIDKETAKQIKKIYEDDEWISLRPLSLEASMKYGANTKWCTTTESGQYYARYSSRGVLIYNINKKTGYKVACFKNLDPNHDTEFSWWDVTDRKIEALDSEAPVVVLEAVRSEIKNFPIYNSRLMSEIEQEKLTYYKEGVKFSSGTNIGTGHLVISGGFTSIGTTSTLTVGGSDGIVRPVISGTGNTYIFNPSTFTTTDQSIFTSGHVGMATTTPNTQISVGGNIELNDGEIVFRSNGEERARLTSNGFESIGLPEPEPNESYRYFEQPTENERRLFDELTREINGGGQEMHQRLEQEMTEQLNEANERVAQKHLSMLENIEMGTLGMDTIQKMQRLAGIETLEQRLARLDTEREQMIADARRADDAATEQDRLQREFLKQDIYSSVYEAEQPVVHLSLWNKIKNIGIKLSRTFTSRSRKQIGALPMSISARLEAVKQSQEL